MRCAGRARREVAPRDAPSDGLRGDTCPCAVRRMSGELRVGCPGWSYKDWNGIVYPPSLKKTQHPVEYLAQYFDLIEINTSFYGHIKPELGLTWCRKASAVNPNFKFTAKLHKAFTHSPVAGMTEWLLSGVGPAGFTLDQDTELRSPAEGNATVRYVGHTLDAEDMRRHIEAGKQCMRLAMTWNDRVSFVLTPSLTIKRIAPLDVLKEASDPTAQNDDERFDSDVTLMTAELDRMLTDLLDALGGEQGDALPQAAAA